MPNIHTWCHYNPVRVVFKEIDAIEQYVTGQHVLLVTTAGFVRRGTVDRVRQQLKERRLTVLSDVKPNPDIQYLDEVSACLKPQGINCVMAIGGGSAIDTAKVLAVMLSSQDKATLRSIFRNNEKKQWTTRLPLVVIPTTSGTGAEITPFATIWDHRENKKYSMSNEIVYPDTALLDASLTLTLGEEDTIYPALDTISHALESLWNKNCNPVSRSYALQALELSSQALPLILKNLKDIKIRQTLQEASVLAGLAISQTKTAIAHSISYPLTTHFGIPHGLACSFTLPALLKLNSAKLLKSGLKENEISEKVKMIKSFELNEKIFKYASAEEIKGLSKYMVNGDRIANYDGILSDNVRGILAHTFLEA